MISPITDLIFSTQLTDQSLQQRVSASVNATQMSFQSDMAAEGKSAFTSSDAVASQVTEAITTALAICCYLAAAESRNDTSTPRKVSLRQTPSADVRSVGFATGRLLTRMRNDAQSSQPTEATNSELSRKSPIPHYRRGFFKTVRHGKGRTLRKLVWILPTFVQPRTSTTTTPPVRVVRDPGPKK